MANFQVVAGGREKLEQELVHEIFRPTTCNHDQVITLIQRLAPKAQLSVVGVPEKSPGVPTILHQQGAEQA